jgi:hypothetical protein
MHVGDCLLSKNLGGALLPWAQLRQREGVEDFVEAMTPETIFFNGLDATTAANAVGQLGYQSYASMRQPLTERAWKTSPNTYVIYEADNAVPLFAQELMAERADNVERLNASHSPFISQPAAVAELIRSRVHDPSAAGSGIWRRAAVGRDHTRLRLTPDEGYVLGRAVRQAQSHERKYQRPCD